MEIAVGKTVDFIKLSESDIQFFSFQTSRLNYLEELWKTGTKNISGTRWSMGR